MPSGVDAVPSRQTPPPPPGLRIWIHRTLGIFLLCDGFFPNVLLIYTILLRQSEDDSNFYRFPPFYTDSYRYGVSEEEWSREDHRLVSLYRFDSGGL